MVRNSLYFVKSFNAESGHVEVHSVSGASGYASFTVQTATPESPTDAVNGKWTVDGGNVYFIKTKNTDTQTIEVHRLSKSSGYKEWDIHSRSEFSIKDADNGTWVIDGDDLYLIKTKNAESGKIEVHRCNHNKGFDFDLHQATGFLTKDGDNATVTIRGGDLYLIKPCDTASGHVEVSIATAASQYQTIIHHISEFSTADGLNGWWEINNVGDLYFVKTENPQSGHIEVHFATKGTDYKPIAEHHAMAFSVVDARNGFWIVDPVA